MLQCVSVSAQWPGVHNGVYPLHGHFYELYVHCILSHNFIFGIVRFILSAYINDNSCKPLISLVSNIPA